LAATAVAAIFVACSVGEQRRATRTTDWDGFDVANQPAPDPPPPSFAGKQISRAEQLRWVEWGEEWFRSETFGNERIWTDVVGILNGSIQVPDGHGGYRDEPFFKYLIEAIDDLDGVRGNLYTGKGEAYTSDLVVSFPPGS